MALAAPDDVLVLADGTRVYPDRVEKADRVSLVEVPTAREAQALVVRTRRKVSELPDLPGTLNAISVILSYTMFGLDDDEIALTVGSTVDQIRRIREQPTYTEMHRSIVKTILDAETNNVRDIFVQHSRKAANTIVQAMDGANAFVAASQILDRANLRPVDIVEHRHRVEGGLTIEIVRREDHKAPIIDIDL